MKITVLRNRKLRVIDENFVIPSDYVLATDGSFRPAQSFLQFAGRFGQVNALEELVRMGVLIGAMHVVAEVLSELWTTVFPAYNREPLSCRTRQYIRERDGEICYYCGDRARDGHVDHMQSRKNRGPNAVWNLTWECAPCNWAKGSMDADKFLELSGLA